MIDNQGFLPSSEPPIFWQRWLPDHCRAVVLIAHGVGEHSGRYQNLTDALLPRGFACYAVDHVGHGRSGGVRCHVKRFDDFLQPLLALHTIVTEEHPGLPVFIVGHSMGGLITCALLLEHQTMFSGAVVCAPPVVKPDYVSGATVVVGKVLSRVLPRARVVAVELDSLTSDPAVLEAYLSDPLVCTKKLTARLGAEMLATTERLQTQSQDISLPLLILQGESDSVVDPAGARFLEKHVGSSDLTLMTYPGLYHELFNEPERDRVLADVVNWLDRHLS